MESIDSVSKGVFLYANGFKISKNKKKFRQGLDKKFYRKSVWYMTYKRNWHLIKSQLKELHQRAYSNWLNNVVAFVKHAYDDSEILDGVIPSASLLTGISQPDHESQFSSLMDMIQAEVTPHVALVQAEDAPSVKHLVEHIVWQLIKGHDTLDTSMEENEKPKLKKSRCTMRTLQNWYLKKYTGVSPRKKRRTDSQVLVVILPDFESFDCRVLQDFVTILTSYVPSLPFVLVVGVATSVSALHKSFPHNVSAKLLVKVFDTHSSPAYLNQVLEEVFLTHTSPFHLIGNSLELLTDMYLFYDLSVTVLMQSIQYYMMEHYYGDNLKSLCCTRDRLEEAVLNLKSEDLESIRQLLSFRPYVEEKDCITQIKLFEDDNFFRKVLLKEMTRLHDYLQSFYLCVRLLSVFLEDMPKNVMGNTVREIYTKCVTESITNTPAFKETMQLLKFQSQERLVESIKSAVKVVNAHLQSNSPIKSLSSTPTKNNTKEMHLSTDLGESFATNTRVHLLTFLRQIENANAESTVLIRHNTPLNDVINTPGSRYRLKESLLNATKENKVESEFELVRGRFVSYLEEVFSRGLRAPHTQPFHEVVFFSDVGDVRKQIMGEPRGPQHTALANPAHYLQCSCCVLPSSDSIVLTLPDLCLAYKLHRECGSHINLYDWMQAFAAVLSPEQQDDTQHQPPDIQLRFTRAVEELQFLGFIKLSTRKTDHVTRLTC